MAVLHGVCKSSNGYNITVGREYLITRLVPQLVTPNFTFPRYVQFIDDDNKVCQGHAYRFKTLSGTCYDEYIKETMVDVIDNE